MPVKPQGDQEAVQLVILYLNDEEQNAKFPFYHPKQFY